MPEDKGIAAAQAFLAERLTSGLPMAQAIARVEKANAGCHSPAAPGSPVVCRYSEIAHPVCGDLGEDIWTVRLIPASDGLLQSATFERSHVGMGE